MNVGHRTALLIPSPDGALTMLTAAGSRQPHGLTDWPERTTRTAEPETHPSEAVAADPQILDTETDRDDSDCVHRGTNGTSLEYPTERADAVRSASAVPNGWVAPTDLRQNVGHAATAASVAPKGSTAEAWEHRPAAMQEGGGNAGSAAASESDRLAFLARVQWEAR